MMGSVEGWLYDYITADSIHGRPGHCGRRYWQLGKRALPPPSDPTDFSDCIGSSRVPSHGSADIYLYPYPRPQLYDTGYRDCQNYRNFVATTTTSPKQVTGCVSSGLSDSQKLSNTPTLTRTRKILTTQNVVNDTNADLQLNRIIINRCIDHSKKLIQEGKKTEQNKQADKENFESQLRRRRFYKKLPSQSLSSLGMADLGGGRTSQVKVTTRVRSVSGPGTTSSVIRRQVENGVSGVGEPVENDMPITWRYYTARDPETNTWRTGRRPAKDIEFADQELDKIKSREDVLMHRQYRKPRYSRNRHSSAGGGGYYSDILTSRGQYMPLSSGYTSRYNLGGFDSLYSSPTLSSTYQEVYVDDNDHLAEEYLEPQTTERPVVVLEPSQRPRSEWSHRSEAYHLDQDLMEERREGQLAIEGPRREGAVNIPIQVHTTTSAAQIKESPKGEVESSNVKGKSIPIQILREPQSSTTSSDQDSEGESRKTITTSVSRVTSAPKTSIKSSSTLLTTGSESGFKEKILTPRRVWGTNTEIDNKKVTSLSPDVEDYTDTLKTVSVRNESFTDSYEKSDDAKENRDSGGKPGFTVIKSSHTYKGLKNRNKDLSTDQTGTNSARSRFSSKETKSTFKGLGGKEPGEERRVVSSSFKSIGSSDDDSGDFSEESDSAEDTKTKISLISTGTSRLKSSNQDDTTIDKPKAFSASRSLGFASKEPNGAFEEFKSVKQEPDKSDTTHTSAFKRYSGKTKRVSDSSEEAGEATGRNDAVQPSMTTVKSTYKVFGSSKKEPSDETEELGAVKILYPRKQTGFTSSASSRLNDKKDSNSAEQQTGVSRDVTISAKPGFSSLYGKTIDSAGDEGSEVTSVSTSEGPGYKSTVTRTTFKSSRNSNTGDQTSTGDAKDIFEKEPVSVTRFASSTSSKPEGTYKGFISVKKEVSGTEGGPRLSTGTRGTRVKKRWDWGASKPSNNTSQ